MVKGDNNKGTVVKSLGKPRKGRVTEGVAEQQIGEDGQ